MGKLYFYYGTMSAGKTSLAINKAFEFKERGKDVFVHVPEICWKSCLESRNGSSIPTSRNLIKEHDFNIVRENSFLIVDECQFLTPSVVLEIKKATVHKNVMAFCFGLLTDFMRNIFDGSRALVETADTIREVPCMCEECDNKAQYNYRITDETKTVVLSKEKYKSLCASCYEKFSTKVQ